MLGWRQRASGQSLVQLQRSPLVPSSAEWMEPQCLWSGVKLQMQRGAGIGKGTSFQTSLSQPTFDSPNVIPWFVKRRWLSGRCCDACTYKLLRVCQTD